MVLSKAELQSCIYQSKKWVIEHYSSHQRPWFLGPHAFHCNAVRTHSIYCIFFTDLFAEGAFDSLKSVQI